MKIILDACGRPVRRTIGFLSRILPEGAPKHERELVPLVGGAAVECETYEPVEEGQQEPFAEVAQVAERRSRKAEIAVSSTARGSSFAVSPRGR